MAVQASRAQVLSRRVLAQQLDRESGSLAETAILDIGVQDTGPDGGLWALALRGVDIAEANRGDLVIAWSIRGAPHLYRRADLPSVAVAVEPFSDADAGKRIYDASKPLKAAGIGNIEALDAVARAMRSIVTSPMTKGDVSTRLTPMMSEPYVRFCRPCNTTHLFEMPFRIAALRAGLELEPGTSPPVLTRIPRFKRAARAKPVHDVVRAYLRLLGPATPKHVAGYLDAPVADVRKRWPDDAVEVSVEGDARWLLADDVESLAAGPVRATRLLGPFDLFLQARDRELLTDDPARVKALWPVLGRPGAVLVDGEVAGTWRPRKSGRSFRVTVTLWSSPTASNRRAITEQAERLAAFRGVVLTGVDLET